MPGQQLVKMMSVRIGKPFNWVKGWASSAVITFCVLTLLAFNLIALGLSVPKVIDAAPREYGSGLEGSLYLPYVPDSTEEMEIFIEENVTEGEPFRFSMTFPDARIPYGQPHLELTNGSSKHSYLLGAGYAEDGKYRLSLLVPGLPYSGFWDLRLILSVGGPSNPHVQALDIGSVPILRGSGERPIIMPDLDGYLTFNGSVSFTRFGGPGGGDIWFQVDGGGIEPMLSTDEGYRVAIGRPGVGWHQGRVIWDPENITNGHDFLFREADPDPGYDEIDIAFERAVRGEDELYGQKHERVVFVKGDPIQLFESTYYMVNISLFEEPGGNLSGISSDLIPYATAPMMTIGYEDVLIPLQLISGDSNYGGIIPINTDEVEISIILKCSGRSSNSSHMEVPVVLMKDHAPSLEIEPDPYLFPYESVDRRLTISPGLAISYGRRFAEDPIVLLSSEKLDLTSSESSEGVKWSVVLSDDCMKDGGALSLEARTEYSVITCVLLIFPFPPFLIGIPPLFIGWSLVGWFLLTSVIIVWASITLILRNRPFFRKGSPEPGDLENALSNWGPVETSRVFSAVIFFSIAVYFLFQMLEQPTPTPTLLSSSVPVWIRLISLAEASVWEEFSGRLLLMGLPLAIIRGIQSKRFFDPRQLLGGSGNFGRSEVGLIIISALSFGMAHLGWGPWKVVPTFVSGLLFGYLFVKVGLHATVVMHFLIDYLGFIEELAGFGGTISTLIILFLGLVGCLLLGDYLFRGTGTISRMIIKKTLPPYFFLIFHSFLSLLLAYLLFRVRGMDAVVVFIASVPLMDIAGFIIHKNGIFDIGKGIVYFSSLITTALGPIGTAWIYSSQDDHDRPL